MPDKARETLVALRQRHPTLRVAVGGRETPIFTDDAEAVDWLVKLIGTQATARGGEADRWLMFRGDAARNASMLGSAPLLNMRWRVLSTDDPQEEKSLEQCRKMYAECGGADDSRPSPLGRRRRVADADAARICWRWTSPPASGCGKCRWTNRTTDRRAATPRRFSNSRCGRQMMAPAATSESWSDMTYGTLSSDGRYVFSVEDVGSDSPAPVRPAGGRAVFVGGGMVRAGGGVIFLNGFNGMNNGEQSSLCNVLAAHDIRTGKLKWQIGGPAGPHALRLAETSSSVRLCRCNRSFTCWLKIERRG